MDPSGSGSVDSSATAEGSYEKQQKLYLNSDHEKMIHKVLQVTDLEGQDKEANGEGEEPPLPPVLDEQLKQNLRSMSDQLRSNSVYGGVSLSGILDKILHLATPSTAAPTDPKGIGKGKGVGHEEL